MEKNKHEKFFLSMLSNLGWPVFWGLAVWICFYVLIHQGVLSHHLIRRYFAGHPVEYAEAAMFFVGVAALAIRMMQTIRNYFSLRLVQLPPIPCGGQPAKDCSSLLQTFEELPERARKTTLGKRLYDALEFVRRKGSADGLDEQLKYLADLEAIRVQEGHGLVRTVIWATPTLGFLGTVIGITLALGGLNANLLVEFPQQAMEGLLAGLGVAFDTTTLALTLSLFLIFFKLFVDEFETQLAVVVDLRADVELVGRFQELGSEKDPHVASLRRMAETMVQSGRDLVERQANVWQTAMDQSQQQWSRISSSIGEQLQNTLSESLSKSLQLHAVELGRIEVTASERNHEHWGHLQTSMTQYAKYAQAQHAELNNQTSVMREVVEATGEVVKLEKALNENLSALAGKHNFEETVMSLAAAIHLLNSRLDVGSATSRQVKLTKEKSKSKGRAA